MKKFFNCFAIALMALTLFSCGSKDSAKGGETENQEAVGENASDENTLKIKLDKSAAYGETGEYLAVVPGTYSLSYKDGNLRIKLRLKLVKPMAEEQKVNVHPDVRLVDADEMDVLQLSARLYIKNSDKFDTFMRGTAGAEEDFLFVKEYVNDGEAATVLQKTKHFLLGSLNVKTQEEIDKNNAEIDKAFDQLNGVADNCKDLIDVSKEAVDMLNELK